MYVYGRHERHELLNILEATKSRALKHRGNTLIGHRLRIFKVSHMHISKYLYFTC